MRGQAWQASQVYERGGVMSGTEGPSVGVGTGNPALPVFNALIPEEGPKALLVNVLFPTYSTLLIDLTLTQQQQRLSVVQSVFIDARNATSPVFLTVQLSNQVIEAAPGSQGYYPLLVPQSGAKFTCASSSTQPVALFFINVPVPADVWNSAGASIGSVSISGPLAVNTPTGNPDPVTVSQSGGSAAWTSHSGTTVASASTALLPAATNTRYFVCIAAPAAADMWVNRIGGVASIGGQDCFKIPAGNVYENFPGESCGQAWNYFCATGSLAYTALAQEGN